MSRPRTLDLPARSVRTTITTPRGQFAATITEPPERAAARTTALLVPGFTGSKEDFISVLEPLRDAGRRVVAIDLRGQYESLGTDDPAEYAVEAQAVDLQSLIDALDEPVHLVGHSFGGFVARAAVRHQVDERARPTKSGSNGESTAERATASIRSLVLMDSGPGRITNTQAVADLALLRDALARMDMAMLWELKRSLERARGDVDPPEPVATFMRERFVRTHPRGLLEAAAELSADIDRVAYLDGSEVPILVVYGAAEDVWAPAELADMARRLGARAAAIEGARHSPAAEQPEATARELSRFWDDVESEPSAQRPGP